MSFVLRVLLAFYAMASLTGCDRIHDFFESDRAKREWSFDKKFKCGEHLERHQDRIGLENKENDREFWNNNAITLNETEIDKVCFSLKFNTCIGLFTKSEKGRAKGKAWLVRYEETFWAMDLLTGQNLGATNRYFENDQPKKDPDRDFSSQKYEIESAIDCIK